MHFFAPILLILIIVPLWRICTRAGFNGALSLLTLIPWIGVNNGRMLCQSLINQCHERLKHVWCYTELLGQ